MKKLKLSDASRTLGMSYQALFRAVVSGIVPAQRDRGGSRWLIDEQDLPVIVERLGISKVES